MKKVIAKRDKSIFGFFLILVLISYVVSGYSIVKALNSEWRWFGIFAIVCLSVIALISLLSLIFLPNATIIKDGENLILYRGVFKKIVSCSCVLFAELAPLQPKEKESKNGAIILKLKTENGEQEFIIQQVKDKKNAIEQLNKLINN